MTTTTDIAKPGDVVEFDDVPAQSKCHQCGGAVIAGTQQGEPVLMHAMPYCETFVRLDTEESMVEYLQACGAKLRMAE